MRITNKIIQNNNLANINTNKIYQDTLSTQMSTQKKINRPSDDPVVAIRALRLRSNVTEITQYYSKNIPDAESWLDVTEDSLNNLTKIITDMISQCTRGANGEWTAEDREIILEQLQALADEVYVTGDADYAGRYVFTGYRTNTSLRYAEEQSLKYSIT
ncbi:MAG: flagellar hook-associated protein 3, partial [Lachnospiraceae bacterium]|nr:flagellar hook-associated protein 3 [Lachnospiraceae bacterium]